MPLDAYIRGLKESEVGCSLSDEGSMDKIEQRFKKWVGWIQGELLVQMQDIILDEYMFRCFENSLKPYTGRETESDIIWWISKNHVSNICLAIRRLDDHDSRTISLRRLLIDMRDSAHIITVGNLEKYCGIKGRPASDQANARPAIEHDLLILDNFGQQIREFVNTSIAHRDSNPVEIPTFGVLREAIDCYHTIYRKWAYILTGMSLQPDMLNPMNLVPEIEEDYAAQFSLMWKCLFDDEEGE
jgi:hypothetical protein